uniref:RxLR effector protein n=1 Tax=Peronospora matthiolae TaxID=2874970 RepID=A0AAV1U838_9STRA
MIKFFLLFALVLAVSTGNRALPAPSDKKLTKLTTPSLDQVSQSELDDKRMLRVTDVTSAATGETRRLLMNKSKKKRNIFSRLKTRFKKWKPVRKYVEYKKRIKVAIKLIKWFVALRRMIEKWIQWFAEKFGGAPPPKQKKSWLSRKRSAEK